MNDYDDEMVLLRHTILQRIMEYVLYNVKSKYITMNCVIGEHTRKVCCPLGWVHLKQIL